MIESVSVTELRAFLRCRREHTYVYALGYKPIERAQPLVFGTLVHEALEAWWRWRPGSGISRADAALLRIAHALAEEPGLVDVYDRIRAEELMRAYDRHWNADGLEVLAVEQEFRAPLVHPLTGEVSSRVELVGRVDAIARDVHGHVWVVEHKTAQNAGPGPYWEKLRIDLQCSVYMIGAQALGWGPYGILYDVIEKPRLSPLRSRGDESLREPPEEFRARFADRVADGLPFLRGTVVRLDADEEEAALDLWWAAHELVELRTRTRGGERAPRNPDACVRYGRMCDFFGPCTNSADLTDERLFRRSERAA